MTQEQITTNIVAVINFVSVVSAMVLSWLGEHWGWFADAKRQPLTKKLIVFGISAVVGIAATGVGSFLSPEAVAKLNPQITAFIAFAFAIGGALANHYGINKMLPAIIKLITAFTAAQGGEG